MSKMETIVVKLSRKRIAAMVQALHGSANVTCQPPDAPETVQKFRYACGKNHAKLFAEDKQTEKLQRKHEQSFKGTADGAAYHEFELKRLEVCLKHCVKDADGTPVLKRLKDAPEWAAPVYSFSAQGQLDFDREIRPLEEQFSKAIDAFNQCMEDCGPEGKVCAELVEVKLHSFPFDAVPKNLNGLHLAGIEEMLVGRPS